MKQPAVFLLMCLVASVAKLQAQQDLLSTLKDQQTDDPGYATSIFKSTRVINSQSVETLRKGNLDFRISHRFGKINSGAYNLFGLDEATIRIGLEYGLTDRITLGLGRSSFQKTFDGFFKTKIAQQKRGSKGSLPVTVTWFSNMAIVTQRGTDPIVNSNSNYNLSYAHQIIIARKFNRRISLQVAPILIHQNLPDTGQPNDSYAIEGGGALSISKRVTINADYVYRLLGNCDQSYYNSLSVGVDIETGGHVFQLHVTNSQGIIEEAFVPRTDGQWSQGDLFYGFNISRQFDLRKKKR